MSRLSLLECSAVLDVDDRVIGGSYLDDLSSGVALYAAPLRNRQRLLKTLCSPQKLLLYKIYTKVSHQCVHKCPDSYP